MDQLLWIIIAAVSIGEVVRRAVRRRPAPPPPQPIQYVHFVVDPETVELFDPQVGKWQTLQPADFPENSPTPGVFGRN